MADKPDPKADDIYSEEETEPQRLMQFTIEPVPVQFVKTGRFIALMTCWV